MKTSLLSLAAASVVALTINAQAAPIPDEYKVGGFAIGCQAWSFNKYSVFEAIEKTAETGAKCIEFFPGQKLSPEHPDVKWGHDASDEVIDQVKAQLAKHHIKAVNYGVVGIPADEAGARKVFDFAKKLGLYGVTTESTGSIEMLDKLSKEYEINVCFHDHPKREKDPNYKVWDPNYILDLVKNCNPRVGSCADTGHWQTSGLKPLDCIKILGKRVLSSHMKDRPEIGKQTADIPYGTGVGQVPEVLAELKSLGFQGNISIEYEPFRENAVPDIAKCVAFVKAWGEKNR